MDKKRPLQLASLFGSRSIRSKFIFTFLVPIALIILLGVFSYRMSSSEIEK
ncbi:MAG: hypothetical protein N2376_14165 [Clostridia bacterium]|nr:hypothetical protein [Clostridia bacterium]